MLLRANPTSESVTAMSNQQRAGPRVLKQLPTLRKDQLPPSRPHLPPFPRLAADDDDKQEIQKLVAWLNLTRAQLAEAGRERTALYLHEDFNLTPDDCQKVIKMAFELIREEQAWIWDRQLGKILELSGEEGQKMSDWDDRTAVAKRAVNFGGDMDAWYDLLVETAEHLELLVELHDRAWVNVAGGRQ